MLVKALLLVALSAKFLVTGKLHQPCQTPDYKDGECIPLQQCQPLKHGPRNIREAEYITSSICDYDGDEPRVCCHLRSSKPVNRSRDAVFVTSDLLPSLDQCGPDSSGKILGGSATELDEFPWMALLAYQDNEDSPVEYQCGGVLINDRYVLTAAHCIDSSLVGVRLGEHDLSQTQECYSDGYCIDPPVDVPIQEIISFRNFTRRRSFVANLHDIALLRLQHKVNFTETIRPICLPNTVDSITDKHVNEKMPIAGWGTTQWGHKSRAKLKVVLPVRPCKQDYSCDSSHVCAGGQIGRDSCRGDSGGPLMYRKVLVSETGVQSNWYAFGVLSGGRGCGENHLGWYAKVSKYMYWIVNNLKP